jgi:hypothetical protein
MEPGYHMKVDARAHAALLRHFEQLKHTSWFFLICHEAVFLGVKRRGPKNRGRSVRA